MQQEVTFSIRDVHLVEASRSCGKENYQIVLKTIQSAADLGPISGGHGQ